MASQIVSGEDRFDAGTPVFKDATVYVRLYNVSQADAPARTVAEQVISGVSHTTHEARLQPFELVCEAVDEKADYIVSVLVDLDDDGEISSGDLITMQSYPVLTHQHPNRILIQVMEVH